jgi:hypothetical protein
MSAQAAALQGMLMHFKLREDGAPEDGVPEARPREDGQTERVHSLAAIAAIDSFSHY